MDKSI